MIVLFIDKKRYDMKILFITGLYPFQEEQYYYRCANGSLQNAANVFQWGVVRGLEENGSDYTVVSYPFLPCFLRGYKNVLTKGSVIKFDNKTIGYSPRYITIPFVKEFYIKKSLTSFINKWIKEKNIKKDEQFAILFYHLYGPFLSAAIPFKRIYRKMILCPIVTDAFYHDDQLIAQLPFWRRIQAAEEKKAFYAAFPYMDKYVFLAEKISDFIPNSKEHNIIVEGIAQMIPSAPVIKSSAVEKTLLYTGSLGDHTSIEFLLDAFSTITNEDYRLVICGDGVLKGLVEDYCAKDKRIVYKGRVLRDEALRLQRDCTVLINPRRPDIPETAYSFPSKTIEYMLSGTPMIGYKLEGIPSEYYNYFYTIPDMDKTSMMRVIQEVLNKPEEELYNNALSAYNFIVKEKSAKAQTKKIIDYLEAD